MYDTLETKTKTNNSVIKDQPLQSCKLYTLFHILYVCILI